MFWDFAYRIWFYVFGETRDMLVKSLDILYLCRRSTLSVLLFLLNLDIIRNYQFFIGPENILSHAVVYTCNKNLL